MKLSKFLIIVVFITHLSLLYVYQQTEIFRLGYVGQKTQTSLDDLLDKNAILRYNIARSASLVEIGDKISRVADFQMPDTYRLVRLAPSRGGVRIKEALPARQTLLTRIFGIKSQAEAKTVNPSTSFKGSGE